MNSKLKEIRADAEQLLRSSRHLRTSFTPSKSGTFNLSDLKADETQNPGTPYTGQRSPFKASEISARSTMNRHKENQNQFDDMDFHEIMKTSTAQTVKDKYLKSVAAGRLSTLPRSAANFDIEDIMKTTTSEAALKMYRESMGRLNSLPRTADMSLRSTFSNNPGGLQSGNFWDEAKVSDNSFGINMTDVSENFQPAEQMIDKMEEDEAERDMEFAVIPSVQKTNSNESCWENRTSTRQPEMSFGQYCQDYNDDIRNIYTNKSPAKKNRIPLVEMSNLESTLDPPNRLNQSNIQKLIKNYDTPKAREMMLNLGKGVNQLHANISKMAQQSNETRPDPIISGIGHMLNSLDFNEITRQTEREMARLKTDKDNASNPLRDKNVQYVYPNDELERERNVIPNRGQKRRTSSVSGETPRSALDKCFRSQSPTVHKANQAAAADLLKPKITDDMFKMPHSSASIRPNLSSTIKSPSQYQSKDRTDVSTFSRSPSSREYLTANSMNSPCEKLSLPNYGLTRPENLFTSPTSSLRSVNHLSPTAQEEGRLRRAVSQLSNGSEFQDDDLPIKIKKTHMKLSWESVKLYKTSSKSFSIQNGSNKKLPLRVKISGQGFSITPREDFRMIPQEARTFEVKFSPTVVGASIGRLTFELATNSSCKKSIPLYAYGGHAAIKTDGVQKGPIGPAFLTMGPIHMLSRVMEQQITLTNNGTLPGFASLMFEKSKWCDFSLSDSLRLDPSEARLAPGETVKVNIRFKGTKDEVRKICNLNKEVTIVGEILIISGDEPTRLRLLNNKDNVPPQFLRFLPKGLPGEIEFKRELVVFNENLDRSKLTKILEQVRTHEIALTVTRNLDDTQIIAAELSMADESTLAFETFCETNFNQTEVDPKSLNETLHNDPGYFESKYFRLAPAKVIFDRERDNLEEGKLISITSTCDEQMYAEAVSSNHELISAIKSCGKVKAFGVVQIQVSLNHKALTQRVKEPMYVSVLIGNAKIDVPVKIVN